MNYNSDMTHEDTPLHITGLEHLVEDQPQDYIGKEALEALKATGVDRKLVGIEWPGDELRAELSWFWPMMRDGAQVGRVTDAIWSPRLERNIGYAWVPIDLAAPGTEIDVESEHGPLRVRTATIPFIDPKKEVPAASLRGE
jgi:aminomethyltransferase